MTTDTAPDIADRPDARRYELTLAGKLAAQIDYRMRGDHTIDLIHTEVAPEHEGGGLAMKIAKFALDDARSRNLKVVPSCGFIASYVRKHSEYEDMLAQR